MSGEGVYRLEPSEPTSQYVSDLAIGMQIHSRIYLFRGDAVDVDDVHDGRAIERCHKSDCRETSCQAERAE